MTNMLDLPYKLLTEKKLLLQCGSCRNYSDTYISLDKLYMIEFCSHCHSILLAQSRESYDKWIQDQYEKNKEKRH